MRSDVTFSGNGLKLAGHLHTLDAPACGSRPAIVVGHPGSGVKEQAAGLYARRLAERGFVTLACDAAYQGASEGEPRGLEEPGQRVEDLKAAVSFLSARDEVTPDRIGALGICASGGYALAATATDHRIRAVGTVSAVDISRQFRLGADGTQAPDAPQSMLAAAAAARTAEARTAEVHTAEVRGEGVQRFPLFPATEAEARRAGPHVHEGWEYYCTPRAEHPRSAKTLTWTWTWTWTWTSVDRIAAFDAFHAVGLIAPRPLLMITGRQAVTSWMSVEAFQKAGTPKELHWIEGAVHNDLYDKDGYVTPAVDRLTGFFEAHLES